MANQTNQGKYIAVLTFDANVCVDKSINCQIRFEGKATSIKTAFTEKILQLYGTITNKREKVKLAYFEHNRIESERVLFNAVSNACDRYHLPKYITNGIYQKCRENMTKFFSQLAPLLDCFSVEEISKASSFLQAHESKIKKSGSMSEPADDSDCKLLVGTSKQNEELKGLLSADGHFTGIPEEIMNEYCVHIVDTKNPISIDSFIELTK